MAENDIVLIVDPEIEIDSLKVAQRIARIAVDGKFWSEMRGTFAFKSNLGPREVRSELDGLIGNFLVLKFDADRVDGKQPDDSWNQWSAVVFRENFRAMLSFHEEQLLSEEKIDEILNAQTH